MKSQIESLMVILGPRTRLGRAVWARCRARGRRVLLMPRDAQERTALAVTVPEADIAPTEGDVVRRNDRGDHEAVVVCACAAGLIHPGTPRWSDDASAAGRDIALITRLLNTYAALPVHVVFVSSVLALASRRGRRYYG